MMRWTGLSEYPGMKSCIDAADSNSAYMINREQV